MSLTGREVLQALQEYFSSSNQQTETFLMLILPACFLIIALLYIRIKPEKSVDPYFAISKQDFELLEHIRIQKGLEEFDRDFLMSVAFTWSIKPTRMLLDPATFGRVEEMMTEKIKKSGEDPASNKSLIYLKNLRKKLFGS